MTEEKKNPSVTTIKQRIADSRNKTAKLEDKLKIVAAAAAKKALPKINNLRALQWVLRGRYYWEEILTPAERDAYDYKVRDWTKPRQKMAMTLAIQATEAAAAAKAAKHKKKKTPMPDEAGTAEEITETNLITEE